MSQFALIVAHDRRRAIGRDGRMPWHLPDDLRHFRALTLGGVVLMGRRTFDSLGKPLAGRENWVLTRDPAWSAPGVRVLHAWEDVRGAAAQAQLWVIGGGEVYRLALADATRIESTEIDTEVAGADTWFPAIGTSAWVELAREAHAADARHAHAFEFVSRMRRA
ncbi:MAG: dihydrofolate reductase [Xanthomonadales bacterium]|nr:Dihydrofolate reductase type 3 [Xanthomonadales bacterium]MCC6594584.1 dihydrofolate reductase [Xanthomonadales bacterium]MCE7932297.1 dihydrofolate reductase [Xanthomonadales bacterium PRO6]